jgi:hypothetical protein
VSDLPLKCECGEFRGVVENVTPRGRVACYCDDCQAAAHALGHARDVRDVWGGTDITPVMPKNFRITKGTLGLLRLTENGLFRWYASCCKTPIANSPNATLPYLGLLTTSTDLSPEERNKRMGRLMFRLQARDAIGQPPKPSSETISLGAILWVIKFMSRAFFKSGAKGSILFPNGQPISKANVLTKEERTKLQELWLTEKKKA